MKKLRIVSLGTAVMVGIVVLTFALTGWDYAMFRFWAPKYENVKRQVFENTYSYNRGMIQELQNMQAQYVTASPESKATLAPIILHRVGEFDEAKLPRDLYVFVQELRRERGLR